MRTWRAASLTTLLLVGTGTMILPVVFGQTQPGSDSQSRLEKLLTQRRDTLARAVELQMQNYRSGTCTLEAVNTVRRQLCEAELDAAKTREERIAVLEKQLDIAKSSVALAEKAFRAGNVTEVDVLQRRATLMSVEIQLLREQKLAE